MKWWAMWMFSTIPVSIDSYHPDFNNPQAQNSKQHLKTNMTSSQRNFTKTAKTGSVKSSYNRLMETSSRDTWIFLDNLWMWILCSPRYLLPQSLPESPLPMKAKVYHPYRTKLIQLASRHAVGAMERRQMLAPSIRYAATICSWKSQSSSITRAEKYALMM